jgi:hypothetical protein
MEVSSEDLVNQIEKENNYDEYNQNNKLVNDISYSYYLNNKLNDNNISDNKQDISLNNENQNIITNNNTSNKRYNSQLTNVNESMENKLNNNNSININNIEGNLRKFTSTLDIRMNERERKKMLLDNIQTQISLRKKTKLEELKKRQEEDAQYLKDMILRYPFGRGGGGAPIRDKSGNLITFRRNLISDPKYNQSPINVDDDYNEVWGKEKGNKKFNINRSQNINNNIINDDEDIIRPFSTNPQINTIKNTNLNFENTPNNIYNSNNNNTSSLKQTYNFSNNNLLNNANNLNNYENTSNY